MANMTDGEYVPNFEGGSTVTTRTYPGGKRPLTQEQRQLIVAEVNKDTPAKEIAKLVGCAESTVRTVYKQETGQFTPGYTRRQGVQYDEMPCPIQAVFEQWVRGRYGNV